MPRGAASTVATKASGSSVLFPQGRGKRPGTRWRRARCRSSQTGVGGRPLPRARQRDLAEVAQQRLQAAAAGSRRRQFLPPPPAAPRQMIQSERPPAAFCTARRLPRGRPRMSADCPRIARHAFSQDKDVYSRNGVHSRDIRVLDVARRHLELGRDVTTKLGLILGECNPGTAGGVNAKRCEGRMHRRALERRSRTAPLRGEGSTRNVSWLPRREADPGTMNIQKDGKST
eukprot:gene24381-biopygen8939